MLNWLFCLIVRGYLGVAEETYSSACIKLKIYKFYKIENIWTFCFAKKRKFLLEKQLIINRIFLGKGLIYMTRLKHVLFISDNKFYFKLYFKQKL